MARTTTDLNAVRERPHTFTWGAIEAIHDIGSYSIVEYIEKTGAKATCFHVYVDGKDTRRSANSLDAALLYAIGFKHCEVNEASYMAKAALKLFGLKDG